MWPFWIGIGFSGRRAHSHLCSKADLIKAKGFLVFDIFAWFMHIIVKASIFGGIIFLKSSISFPAEDCWTPSPLGRGSKWTHHLCHYTQVDFPQDHKFAQPLLNWKFKSILNLIPPQESKIAEPPPRHHHCLTSY